mgnify:CR=1 FL=1
MKTIKVTVGVYVNTMREIDVKDDFDVNDKDFLYDLAHVSHVEDCLRNNFEDCLRENAEVVLISDAETEECYYEQ